MKTIIHTQRTILIFLFTLILAACSSQEIPLPIPNSFATALPSNAVTSVHPTATAQPTTIKVSTPTIIATSTATSRPTSTEKPKPSETPTPEAPAFIPEGFSVGPMIRNPETGNNTLTFNPAVSASYWAEFRKQIVEGLRIANLLYVQHGFSLPSNDATKSKTEEAFDKLVSEGPVTIGLPVRDNTYDIENLRDRKGVDSEYNHERQNKSGFMQLKNFVVDLSLPIEFQFLGPEDSVKFTGDVWTGPNQIAISQTNYPRNKGNGAVVFSVGDQGQLVITICNFDASDKPVASDGTWLTLGRLDQRLAQGQYSFLFIQDGPAAGLGEYAGPAYSFYAGVMTLWLPHFTSFAHTTKGAYTINGKAMRTIGGVDLGGVVGAYDSYPFTKIPLFIISNPNN